MTNPYDEGYMTWVVENKDRHHPFNPKLTANNAEVTVVAASIYHETQYSARVSGLLKRILWDHDGIDADYLNSIGFSKQDASALGIDIDGLENINVPINWQDEL
ncbi:TPA: hypothetical protein L3N15_004167 [Vibrio parahaemolyticus]|nr:hypothetical protein [Vibrio parahaemolyticus]